MNAVTIVLVTSIMFMNGFLILSMLLGGRGIKDKTSKAGIIALLVTLIIDMLAILGGVLIW